MSLNAPNIYIQEQSRLLTSGISGADTVAAFIGYTEKGPRSEPVRVRSLMEYEKSFGAAEVTRFDVTVNTLSVETASYALSSPPRLSYYLYHGVRMYFANGGGECLIVSVGSYEDTVSYNELLSGLNLLPTEKVDLLLCADAAQLSGSQYYQFCVAMLAQCNAARDRFALMDLQQSDSVSGFRNGIGNGNLDYGAVYTPYLVSTLPYRYDDASVNVTIDGRDPVTLAGVTNDSHVHHITALLDKQTVTLPPSGAVAGVCAQLDYRRGTWKSPANIPLQAVLRPEIKYSDASQSPLNVDTATGKSINVIRSFSNRGVLPWGARTLDGNNAAGRYVATRRLLIKIERDLKQLSAAFISEANISRTWAEVKTAVESYLDQLWRRGALSGEKAHEAYSVETGLGETMTAQDVLDGRLRISVSVAVFRPAEFITFTFTQGHWQTTRTRIT